MMRKPYPIPRMSTFRGAESTHENWNWIENWNCFQTSCPLVNRKLVANARGRCGLLKCCQCVLLFFRLNYSNVKSLCWLPCARLHSNTQFEAKVRELLKDRLILRAALYSHNRKTRLPLAVRRGSYWLVIAIWISVCYCVHHAIMRVFQCLLLLIKIDVSYRLITLGDLFVFDLSRHSNCVPSCRLWITLFVGKPSLGSVTNN